MEFPLDHRASFVLPWGVLNGHEGLRLPIVIAAGLGTVLEGINRFEITGMETERRMGLLNGGSYPAAVLNQVFPSRRVFR